MKLNKKVTLGASALVLGATLIGGTMAWLTSEETIVNKFSTKSWDLEVDVEENFKPEEGGNLLPGAEITKEGWVENTKDLPVLVRVSIKEVWGYVRNLQDQLEVDEDLTQAAINANAAVVDTAKAEDATINGEVIGGNDYSSDKWELIGDYFYYTDVLAPEEKTTNVISDVTINPNLTVDQHKQFGGKLFDIILKGEAVQIENNAYLSAWDIEDKHAYTVNVLVEKAIGAYNEKISNPTPTE